MSVEKKLRDITNRRTEDDHDFAVVLIGLPLLEILVFWMIV